MKKMIKFGLVTIFALNLFACAASTYSSTGTDCAYDGRPLEEMPIACQGGR
jgi:hypothetical protein